MHCTVSHCDFLYLSSKRFFHVAVLLGTIMLHRLLYKQRMVMFVVTPFLLLSKLTRYHRNFFPLSKPVLFGWVFSPFLQNLVQPDNHTSPKHQVKKTRCTSILAAHSYSFTRSPRFESPFTDYSRYSTAHTPKHWWQWCFHWQCQPPSLCQLCVLLHQRGTVLSGNI